MNIDVNGSLREVYQVPGRAARELLLSERPAHELTVAAIMQATTLSRKSFYVCFRDRSDLITALVTPLRAQPDAALAPWRQARCGRRGRPARRSAWSSRWRCGGAGLSAPAAT